MAPPRSTRQAHAAEKRSSKSRVDNADNFVQFEDQAGVAAEAPAPEEKRKSKAKTAPKTGVIKKKMPAKRSNTASQRKQTPARSSRKSPWSEEQLTQSTRSRYLDADLVRLFAKPEAWDLLDPEDQEEIMNLLPEHVHNNPEPDEDGKYPNLPAEFLRYSTDWRDGVRLFSEDLAEGRYDPEWQKQALQAMEERAEGKFDDFKEKQFEEFWGQKQKISYYAIAGESAKIKLEDLVKEGVIRIGDVWKYSRFMTKKADNLLVEKEVQVVDIAPDYSLEFIIPPANIVVLPAAGVLRASEAKTEMDELTNEEITSKTAPGSGDLVSTEEDTGSPPEQGADHQVIHMTSKLQEMLDPITKSTVDQETSTERSLQTREISSFPKLNEYDGSTLTAGGEELSQGLSRFSRSLANYAEGLYDVGESLSNLDRPSSKTFESDPSRKRFETEDSSSSRSGMHLARKRTSSETENLDNKGAKKAARREASARSTTPVSQVDRGSDEDLLSSPLSDIGTVSAPSSPAQAIDKDAEVVSKAQATEEDAEDGVLASQASNGKVMGTLKKMESGLYRADRIANPRKLETRIMEIEGRPELAGGSNAWKFFRCLRDHQDMGALWEVRQAYFERGAKQKV